MFGFDTLGKIPFGALPDDAGTQNVSKDIVVGVSGAAVVTKGVGKGVSLGLDASAVLGSFAIGKAILAGVDASLAFTRAIAATLTVTVEAGVARIKNVAKPVTASATAAATVVLALTWVVLVTAGVVAQATVIVGRLFKILVTAAVRVTSVADKFIRALVELPVVGGALTRLAGAITTLTKITGFSGTLQRLDKDDGTVTKLPTQGGSLNKSED